MILSNIDWQYFNVSDNPTHKTLFILRIIFSHLFPHFSNFFRPFNDIQISYFIFLLRTEWNKGGRRARHHYNIYFSISDQSLFLQWIYVWLVGMESYTVYIYITGNKYFERKNWIKTLCYAYCYSSW